MNKLFAILPIYLLIMGCHHNVIPEPRDVPEEAYILVAESLPEPPETEMPEIPFYNLTEEDRGDYSKTADATVESIIRLEGFAEELMDLLDGYRKGNREELIKRLKEAQNQPEGD